MSKEYLMKYLKRISLKKNIPLSFSVTDLKISINIKKIGMKIIIYLI